MEARERQETGQAGRWLLETMRPEQRFGVREDQEEHKMLNLSSFPWGQAPLDVLEVCQLDTRRKEAGKAVGAPPGLLWACAFPNGAQIPCRGALAPRSGGNGVAPSNWNVGLDNSWTPDRGMTLWNGPVRRQELVK